jgi:type I restriction-modification system DNA methylase subunit
MSLHRQRCQKYLQNFDFESLFIEELGWDTVDRVTLPFEVDGEPLEVVSIAQKRGFIVFKCITPEIPARPIRVKLDRQLTDYSKSHLLVFGDEGKTQQTWMWVRQELGKPLAPRFEQYQVGQTAERLLQKLEALAIAFAEEEKLTLVEVAQRVKKAFDVEKVTKKFFTRFEKEHGQFLKLIDGIQSEFDRTWYASLMLNRLMFVYFIQKKNFLDGDINYLRNRLKRCQAEWGTDTFHSFYRQFLLKLFHEGLGKPGRDAELDKLLGKVPYLNGGLFEVHQLEEKYEETIQIPDAAFETVFNFFDEYDWHLDDRPLRNQNEINPDVLGYIFEKYINQKQMGAYYTKEDITEYISKNTIIPFLFDAAEKACKIAFKPDGALWALLREKGDRYIYEAVRQGVDLDLPAEIAAGIEDVSQRGGWNKPAAAGFALPTETWREHVARRKRCLELRQKLAAGEITQINDPITYNLDIRQFAQDVITGCESSDLLKALYQAIEQVSILDPTCGSGAFLFAALNILEPLYTACLERMQGFVDEDDLRLSQEADAKPRYEYFRKVLAEMAKHPNPRYFVLKSIMLNNLYGVDIMEEATEICKLRLFLKLVAQMEAQPKKDNFGLEPLPDIDFNIRAGNTLVGFASLDEVRKAIKQDGDQLKLDFQDDASRIDEKAELADRAFQRFRQMQTEFGMDAGDFRTAKKELRRRLAELNEELNRYLAREYGIDINKPATFEKWRNSHQPFHWFVEFYSIIDRGGFDVIIGNPPYIESSKVKSLYDIQGLTTLSCGNLYAICMERSLQIMKDSALLGFVVQQPFSSTQRMKLIRNLLLENSSMVLCSTYDDRPSKLFDGINHARIAISISQKSPKNKESKVYVTPYEKWYKEERERLFQVLSYSESKQHVNLGCFPKISSFLESEIIEKIISCKNTFSSWISPTNTENNIYYKITGVGHWFTITARPPKFLRQGKESSSTRESSISFSDKEFRDRALSVLNSSLFYWFYQVRTNCRDFNPSDYKTFPTPLSLDGEDLSKLSEELCKALDLSSAYINVNHSQTGAIQMEQFKPREAKPIIDEIDRVLAQHYGFTAEELDFIINYDIKYRMGRDSES